MKRLFWLLAGMVGIVILAYVGAAFGLYGIQPWHGWALVMAAAIVYATRLWWLRSASSNDPTRP